MENEQVNILSALISEHLDRSGKTMLQLCLVPSFFTLDLLFYCLPRLSDEPISKKNIESFLSLPFVLCSSSAETDKIFYTIHDRVHDSILLTPQEYKRNGLILIEYFDKASSYENEVLAKKYFYEKIFCEVEIGQLYSWQCTYQAALETQQITECDQLMMYLESANKRSVYNLSEWTTYYSFENRYIHRERTSVILADFNVFFSKHFFKIRNEIELLCNCYVLQGVLYWSLCEWEKSYELLKEALKLCEKFSLNIAYTTVCNNIAAVFCSQNKFDKAERYCALAEQHPIEGNPNLKVALLRIEGLIAKKKYKWVQAHEKYNLALYIMEQQQKRNCRPLNLSTATYHPCPVFITDEVGIYNRLGEILLLQGLFSNALEAHTKEKEVQLTLKDNIGLAWSEYNIGKPLYLIGDTFEAKKSLESSINLFLSAGSIANIAYPLGEISYVFQYNGQPDHSFEVLKKSIEILLKYRNYDRCITCFNNLGRICQSQGFLRFAEHVFFLCLKCNEKLSATRGWILNNLARNFMYLKNYKDAETCFDAAARNFERFYDKRGLIYVCNNKAELFAKTGQRDLARELFFKSLSEKKALGDQHAICYTYREIGELEISEGRFVEAEKALQDALDLCTAGCYTMLEGDIHLSRGKLLLETQEFEGALECFEAALSNYNKQNYFTRIANCFKLEMKLAEQVGNKNLYSNAEQGVLQTERKLFSEEKSMLKQLTPLIEQIRQMIMGETNGYSIN